MKTEKTNEKLVNNSNQFSNQKSSNLSPIEFLEQRILELEKELKELSITISKYGHEIYYFSFLSNEYSLTEIDYVGCKKELEWLKSGDDKTNGFIFDIEDYFGERLFIRLDKIYNKYFKEEDDNYINCSSIQPIQKN